jgi:methyl-accepting chemotaxis protein
LPSASRHATLKTNFNEAVSQLRGLIGSVITSAEQLRTGSIEIAQASEDLARRTESNAASLEETAAGVGQMDGRLKATASAARDTVTRADQTKVTVASGRSVADEAVQAMGRVSDSAKGIDSVIEGLDKIAFQTRVLAMNAAVEAGRAGEAGRGFAVVADLVSALAMRAEEEAKRARDQLTVTQADVVTAVEAVQKVDGALQNISGDVEQVHSLLATIAADNQAQAGAITEINAAVGSMDQATQQNAAMVEETSAAARNLLAEVNALSEQAGRFTTGAENIKAPRVPRAGKEGAYRSPVKALPAQAIAALTAPAGDDDWREF